MASTPRHASHDMRDGCRTQWISGILPVAAPACAVGAQRFARPSTLLAEDVDKPGSALRTQSVLNASVFSTIG
ncbi:hypothetical protein KEC55_07920 [Burkholderia cepacia]|nr:hypothetical protein KEC55_07920 [Burkholderia cepacia]